MEKPKVRESRAQKIQEVFQAWDVDGVGYITKADLRVLIAKLMPPGTSMSKEDIDRLMLEADRNCNGRIEYQEFLDWLTRPGASLQTKSQGVEIFDLNALLRPLFDVYDRDGDGNITQKEFEECHNILQTALTLHPMDSSTLADPSMINQNANSLFARVDTDANQRICFREFVTWQREALERSGLLNEDLVDLIPALTRQLMRVFRLSESNEKGELVGNDQNVLLHITKNVANFSRDIYNDQNAGHSTLRGRHHYQNRWSEPPVGLNLSRLKGYHLKLVALPTWGVEDTDLGILCVPETQLQDPRKRRWLAKVIRTVFYKAGRQEVDAPCYYLFEDLQWVHSPALGDEFEKALASLPPELRIFCLLKSEANFGLQMSWEAVQSALKKAVQMELLTAIQRDRYNTHMDQVVAQSMQETTRMAKAIGTASRVSAAEVERLRAKFVQAPRNVMAALAELGILKVSSVWADVLKA